MTEHYQFYANMAVAAAFVFALHLAVGPPISGAAVLGFVSIESVFVATSRDTLRKYYARTARLLGSLPRAERSAAMANGNHPPKPSAPPKPAAETKKPTGSSQ